MGYSSDRGVQATSGRLAPGPGVLETGEQGPIVSQDGGLGHEFGTGPLGKTTQITVSGDRSPEARLPGESEGPDSSAADTVIHTAGSGETGRGPTRPGSPSPPGRCKRVPGRKRGWWKKVPFMYKAQKYMFYLNRSIVRIWY